MTTTHILSDETGQLILAQLQAISQALDAGALSGTQIDTVLADQTPTGAGFLDGGGLKRFFDGLQAQFADISHNHSGDALTPASVTATGAIQGSSISDGTGTLAQLRESVSNKATCNQGNGLIRVQFNISSNGNRNIEFVFDDTHVESLYYDRHGIHLYHSVDGPWW